MTRLGADPEDLLRLRAELDRAAATLTAVASRTGWRLRSARWSGPDATATRRDWDRRSAPALAEVAGRCRAASARLTVQIDQQRAASRPSHSALHPPTSAAIPSEGRPPQLAPVPTRTTRVEATGGISGVVAVAGGEMAVETEVLADGRRAVTVTTEATAGAAASVGEGLGITVDGRGGGKGAIAGIQLTGAVAESRRWEVGGDEVRPLLAQVAAEHAAGTTPLTALLASARRALPGDSLVDRPVSVERTVGADLGAEADLRSGSGGARAAADAGVRVGDLRSDDGRAVVVEYEGVLAAEALAPLVAISGHRAPAAAVESRVRLVAPTSGARSGTLHLVVESTLSGRSGAAGSVDRVEASFGRPAAGSVRIPDSSDVAAAAAALARGDVVSAARHLAGPIGDRPVEVRGLRGDFVERRAGVAAESGAGFELGGRSTTTTWRISGSRRP